MVRVTRGAAAVPDPFEAYAEPREAARVTDRLRGELDPGGRGRLSRETRRLDEPTADGGAPADSERVSERRRSVRPRSRPSAGGASSGSLYELYALAGDLG